MACSSLALSHPEQLGNEILSDVGAAPVTQPAVRNLLAFGEPGRVRVSLLMHLGRISD